MGVTGRIKIGQPGWLLAEGHAPAMEEFNQLVKKARMKQLKLKWEDTETLQVNPHRSILTEIEASRLFPHGMYEVSASDFGKDLNDAGLHDVFKRGTGMSLKYLLEKTNGKNSKKRY